MANGETSGWNRTKSAVASWWHRSGCKTVAHVAVPLAIIFGAVAALQRIELHSHHLVIPTDPVGPNWAEIAMAVFTLILVFGAILALGAVRQARRAVREARRARNAVQMSELSRRWDEEPNREVRRQVRGFAESGQDGFVPVAPPGPQRLKEVVTRFRHDNAPEYRMLLTDPNFLEDVAIMIEEGGIDFEIVNRSTRVQHPLSVEPLEADH